MNEQNSIPFRWNIKSKSELGQLIQTDFVPKQSLLLNIRECAAKVLQFTAGQDLVFVGRSLDSVYDYLTGLSLNSRAQSAPKHLNISLYGQSLSAVESEEPQAILALKAHFTQLKIDPTSIKKSNKGMFFVDVVNLGGTFSEIFEFIRKWSQEINEDVPAVLRKMGFIGITIRTKNSPNTWRWQQHKDWVKALPKSAIKNISVSHEFWDYLGNSQPKMTASNRPINWFLEPLEKPSYDELTIHAINMAYAIYERAKTTEEQLLFKTLIQQ